jgi:threonine/homoserine/homoserine lactone efflux protein
MIAFWEGVLAGYGIAIPVGAIAILIVETSLRKGFRSGFAAGAGASTVDLLYAAVAVVLGAAVALIIAPYTQSLRVVSALVLVAVGGYGLWRVRAASGIRRSDPETGNENGLLFTYTKFIGLTTLNPLTVVYFAALVLGRDAGATLSTLDRVLFVVGAGLASLSWQTALAVTGALAKRYLSPRFRLFTTVLGNLIVITLGLRIGLQIF